MHNKYLKINLNKSFIKFSKAKKKHLLFMFYINLYKILIFNNLNNTYQLKA